MYPLFDLRLWKLNASVYTIVHFNNPFKKLFKMNKRDC